MSTRTRFGVLAFVVAASIGCAGTCYYSAALHPALTAEDLVFDSTLLGSWIVAEEEDTTVFVFQRADTSRWYELLIISGGDTADLRVGVGRFHDAWIADVYPSRHWGPWDGAVRAYEDFVVPAQQIVRLWLSPDTLKYAPLRAEWLDRMNELRRVRTPHQIIEMDDGRTMLYLLTGSTQQVHDLLRQHATDSSAFGDPAELVRATGGKSP